MVWNCIKKILFLWNAETVHEWSIWWIQLFSPLFPKRVSKLEHTVAQIHFDSPVGLAAGFDKNGKLMGLVHKFGFGFLEIGTVTLLPQSGNEKPRLFRFPVQKSLWNRMGFNNDGAEKISERLRKWREKNPKSTTAFKVGVNLGKNKATSNEDAPAEYGKVCDAFAGLADFFVINVSSPNTPGLRELQSESALKSILNEVFRVLEKKNDPTPVFLKIAPEWNENELRMLIQSLESTPLSGWVVTNTLAGTYLGKTGGWSGEKITNISREILTLVRSWTAKPVISVGGIHSEEEALCRWNLGADLLEIYSGWIYQGLFFPKRIIKKLSLQKHKNLGG